METEFEFHLSKSGIPCLWEEGGGATNTGRATLVARHDGGRKKAIYIRRSGHLSNREHALIPIRAGDYIIVACHHRGDYTIYVYLITSLSTHIKRGKRILMFEYSQGEWNITPPSTLRAVVAAAKEKASCYHCREPHYVIPPSH
ncbi:MAG: hypothetical protein QXQ68_05895 [Candidatus Nitrosocaldaceae archaeon]